MGSVKITVYQGDHRHVVEKEWFEFRRANGEIIRPTSDDIDAHIDDVVARIKKSIKPS